jgi:hypothetical protein
MLDCDIIYYIKQLTFLIRKRYISIPNKIHKIYDNIIDNKYYNKDGVMFETYDIIKNSTWNYCTASRDKYINYITGERIIPNDHVNKCDDLISLSEADKLFNDVIWCISTNEHITIMCSCYIWYIKDHKSNTITRYDKSSDETLVESTTGSDNRIYWNIRKKGIIYYSLFHGNPYPLISSVSHFTLNDKYYTIFRYINSTFLFTTRDIEKDLIIPGFFIGYFINPKLIKDTGYVMTLVTDLELVDIFIN